MTPVLSVMSRAGWAACGVLALAGIVAAASCWPALSAAFAKADPAKSGAPDPKQAEALHKQSLLAQAAATKGRSLFFIPPRPAPPPPTRPKDDTPRPPPPPPVDPKPSRYGGPSIQAIVTGSVWFSDGKKAEVGETIGSGSSAVTVLAADSPYAVKLKWKEQEWDVPMFDRDGLVFPAPGTPLKKTEEPLLLEKKPDEKKPADSKVDPKADEKKPADPKADPKAAEPKPGDAKPDPAGDPKADPKAPPAKTDDPKHDASNPPATTPAATPNDTGKKPVGRP